MDECVYSCDDPKRQLLRLVADKHAEQNDDYGRYGVAEYGIERPQGRVIVIEPEIVVQQVLDDRQRDQRDTDQHDPPVGTLDIRIEQNDEQKAEQL